MRFSTALLVCCALLSMYGCGEEPLSADIGSDVAYVVISSLPPHATVTIDGEAVGVADSSRLRVSAGTRHVCLFNDSCDTCFDVTFVAGDNPGLHVVLPCSSESPYDSSLLGAWYTARTFRYGANNSGIAWERDYTVESAKEMFLFEADSVVDIVKNDSLNCYTADTLAYQADGDTILWHFASGDYENVYDVSGDSLRIFIGEHAQGQIVSVLIKLGELPVLALCE